MKRVMEAAQGARVLMECEGAGGHRCADTAAAPALGTHRAGHGGLVGEGRAGRAAPLGVERVGVEAVHRVRLVLALRPRVAQLRG